MAKLAQKSIARFSTKSMEFIGKAARQKNPLWLDKHSDEHQELLVKPMQDLMLRARKELLPLAVGYRFPTRGFARLKRNKDKAASQGMYKSWTGVHISRDSGSRYEDCPSLYFHISDKEVFTAGGLYMPSAKQIKYIRAWIDYDPSQMEALFKDKKFKKHFSDLGDERVLKTKPRDYPIDHPKIEWLKLSGWYVWRPISKKELNSKNFAENLIEDWKQVLRFNQILDFYTKSWPSSQSSQTAAQSLGHARGNALVKSSSRKSAALDLDDIRAPQIQHDWED